MHKLERSFNNRSCNGYFNQNSYLQGCHASLNIFKSSQIQTENSNMAISLLNNINNLSIRAVKSNCILGNHESFILLFNCLVVIVFHTMVSF